MFDTVHFLFFILLFFLGTLFGSFVTCISYRIPRNQDFIFKRSFCTSCKHVLGFFDLIPIFSWLLHKRSCHYCGTKVHYRYPLIEMTLGILFVFIGYRFGLSFFTLSLCGLAIVLVTMSTIDFEFRIIPDSLQIALIPIGILYWYYNPLLSIEDLWLGPLIGLLGSAGLRYGYYLVRKREGLGMGDVKFFTVAGLFLGVKLFAPFLFISGLLGTCLGIVWKHCGLGDEFPFGPALAVALFFCATYPDYVLRLFYFI